MQKRYLLSIPSLFVFIAAILIVLSPAESANGQCGSQASSCKNCHEIQGQDPVNNDGTGWHQSHAFGDFCEFCHAGNVQAVEKESAHTGMVPPLSDVQASCGSCHPADLMDKAGVYATALGVTIGTGGSTGGSSPNSGADPPTNAGNGDEPASDLSLALPGAEVIDFSRQYEETVLGKRFVNWGDLVVGLMIAAVTLGGGGFVIWNERRLRSSSSPEPENLPQQTASAYTPPTIEGLSPELLALLPRLAALNPIGIRALDRLLDNPEGAADLLYSLSRLDPELLRRMRSLDRTSRALLLALAGSGD